MTCILPYMAFEFGPKVVDSKLIVASQSVFFLPPPLGYRISTAEKVLCNTNDRKKHNKVLSNTVAKVCGKGYETAQMILRVILCDVADTSTASGVHTHTCTHAHTHAHTRTHTHTHIPVPTVEVHWSSPLAQLCGEEFMPGFIITEIIIIKS